MINKKSIFKLLFIFLFVSFAIPNFTHAKSCQSLFENKKVFFTPERKKKYLRLALIVTSSVSLVILAWQKIEEEIFWPKMESKVALQSLDVTERNQKTYNDLLAYDFRFKDINSAKFDLEASKIDPKLSSLESQKRIRVYNLQQGYLNYYQKYQYIPHPSQLTLEQNVEKFGADPLFSHLNYFLEGGNQGKAPSDQQKNQLFMLTHKLYTQYALIDLAFAQRNHEVLNKSEEIRTILKEPYTKQLLELEKQNKINRTQLVYFLQEDAYHSYYFSIFETLDIKEVITLNDLREDRTSSL